MKDDNQHELPHVDTSLGCGRGFLSKRWANWSAQGRTPHPMQEN
jgi:hypothetical protein